MDMSSCRIVIVGLLEVIWKVVEAVIDTWIKTVVQFHDVLHRFFSGRGARTAIMELKIAQELASVDQDPILLVFLDLSKAYNNLYNVWLLKKLAGYGGGPKIQGLLAEFWLHQELVTRQNRLHGPQFRATIWTTQGRLESPTLLNVKVDSVVRHCLPLTV